MVTGTIPLFVRFRRQATLNIILSPNLSIKFASTDLANNDFTDLFKYLKFRESTGISLTNSSTDIMILKEGKIAYNYSPSNLLKDFERPLITSCFFLQHDHVLSDSPHHRAKSRTLAHEFEQFCDFDRSSPEAPISTIRMSFYIFNENTKICATNRNKI